MNDGKPPLDDRWIDAEGGGGEEAAPNFVLQVLSLFGFPAVCACTCPGRFYDASNAGWYCWGYLGVLFAMLPVLALRQVSLPNPPAKVFAWAVA